MPKGQICFGGAANTHARASLRLGTSGAKASAALRLFSSDFDRVLMSACKEALEDGDATLPQHTPASRSKGELSETDNHASGRTGLHRNLYLGHSTSCAAISASRGRYIGRIESRSLGRCLR